MAITPNLKHSDRGHSELPPSSANKWMFCYGWRATVAQHHELYGRPPSSAAAEEGTAAHEKMERHLLGLPAAQAPDWVLTSIRHEDVQVWEDSARELDVDDDEYNDLMPCIEWVQDQPGELYTEQSMDFGAPFGYHNLTGTGDITLVGPEDITIGDLKFGKVVVEVADEKGNPNPQLMIYLVAAIHKFGPRPSYRIAILQPRAWHKHGPIRELIVTPAMLALFQFDLENAIEASYNGGPCTPGPWCRKYCDALSSCRAVVLAGRQRLRDNPPE